MREARELREPSDGFQDAIAEAEQREGAVPEVVGDGDVEVPGALEAGEEGRVLEDGVEQGLVETEEGYPVVGYDEINGAPLEEQAGDLVPDPGCSMQEGVNR